MADGFSRIKAGLLVDKAERARRFLGSCRTVLIQESVLAAETSVLRGVASVVTG